MNKKNLKISQRSNDHKDHQRNFQAIYAGGLAGSSISGNGDGTYDVAKQSISAIHLTPETAAQLTAGAAANGGLLADGSGNLFIDMLSGGGLALSGNHAYVQGAHKLSADGSPASGDWWFNTSTNSYKGNANGVVFDVAGKIGFTTTASNSVTNTLTETDFSQAQYTLPANWSAAGRIIRFRGAGLFSAVAGHTLRLRFYMGGVVIGDTGAIAMGAASGQNFFFDHQYLVGSAGVSGAIYSQGFVLYSSSNPDPILRASSTVDTTASCLLKVSAQWGTANVGDAIQIYTSSFEIA